MVEFEKINVEFDLNKISSYIGDLKVSYNDTFLEYSVNDPQGLSDLIQDNITFKIQPSKLLFTTIRRSGTKIHTDAWPVSMNIYLYSSDASMTQYYEDTDAYYWQERPGNTRTKIFTDTTKMIPSKQFIAKTGDCYLINTSLPHRVIQNSAMSSRQMLRLVWQNRTYDEILNSMTIR